MRIDSIGLGRGRGLRRLALGAGILFVAAAAAAQPASVGLSPIRGQRIGNQTLTGFPVAQNDRFGWSLAAGDFNGDGRDELATGIPFDDGPTTAPVTDGGAIIVSQ